MSGAPARASSQSAARAATVRRLDAAKQLLADFNEAKRRPRRLRHTFVSVMSDSNVAVEEIARLVGHASSEVSETVYRHQLRPVMTTGAEKMDALLGAVG